MLARLFDTGTVTLASFILTAAIRAVKSRIGIWKAYDSIVDIVPEVTREEWAQAVGAARNDLAQRVSELTRPLNRRPLASEFGTPLEWKSNRRYAQTVEVFLRDRETGARSVRFWTLQTDSLRSRLSVVQHFIDKTQAILDADPERYPLDVVGFAYTGTYSIVRPGG